MSKTIKDNLYEYRWDEILGGVDWLHSQWEGQLCELLKEEDDGECFIRFVATGEYINTMKQNLKRLEGDTVCRR